MHALVVALVAGVGLTGADALAKKTANRGDIGAASYEQLATTIIAVRAAEDALVGEILANYHGLADEHLAAAETDAKNRASLLEAAAAEITNIANEGNKRIQAVRQRLAQAGHTHNSDADTKEDYMYISSKEKKELLALAKKTAQLGAKAAADQIAAVHKELDGLFAKCMTPEKGR